MAKKLGMSIDDSGKVKEHVASLRELVKQEELSAKMMAELKKFKDECQIYFNDKTQEKYAFDSQVKTAGEELSGMKEKLKSSLPIHSQNISPNPKTKMLNFPSISSSTQSL